MPHRVHRSDHCLQRSRHRRGVGARQFACFALALVLLSACGASRTAATTATPSASTSPIVPTPASTTAQATISPSSAPATATTLAARTATGGALATPSQSGGIVPATPGAASCAAGIDLVGWSDALDKTTFANTDVGGLSGLTYDATNDRYYAIVDNEGTTPARFYTLRIPVESGRLGTPQVVASGPLRDGAGQGYTGRTFDGEGIAFLPGGDLLIASETEPSIRRFAPDGHEVAALPVPHRFLVQPQGEATSNLTFESLALTPDGNALYTANEGPLASDGLAADGRGRLRILRYDNHRPAGFAPVAQYFYLAEPAQGVSDLVALGDSDLLVLERGFTPGVGNTIRLYRVSLAGAADISDQASLAAPNLTPLRKELLLNLRYCPADGARNPAPQPNPLLDNFEGAALGPPLPDGRRLLLLISDDNFAREQVTRIIALAFRP